METCIESRSLALEAEEEILNKISTLNEFQKLDFIDQFLLSFISVCDVCEVECIMEFVRQGLNEYELADLDHKPKIRH